MNTFFRMYMIGQGRKELWKSVKVIFFVQILTIDDLTVGVPENYDYYEYGEHEYTDVFEELYRAKINKMDAEKVISEAKAILQHNRDAIEIQAKEIIEKSKLRERDDDYCR